MKSIIDFQKINSALKNSKKINIDDILSKSLKLKKISLNEISVLLNVDNKKDLKKIFDTAFKIKETIFGKRIVLFAPLYLSNECVNNCLYCGFRRDNKDAVRITLSIKEIVEQAKILNSIGFKRVLLVAGENPRIVTPEYIISAVENIYKHSDMRIVHLNSAPFKVEEFKKLHKAGLGVYQLFQETYHLETYLKMHPHENEKNYYNRISIMDRAIKSGIKDVGIGALFGLYDYKFETLALIAHSRHLEEKFGCNAHTISVPRLRPARGAIVQNTKYAVDDLEFKKLVAVLRIAVPSAGIVVSTRESENLRNELILIGASQISAGSKTSPGGYSGSEEKNLEQFSVDDMRPLDKVIYDVASLGLVPSVCSACYRVGRTGKVFNEQSLNGNIKNFCLPNALLTLQEYVLDNASSKTKNICDKVIKNNLAENKLPNNFKAKLKEIKEGKRDIFY